MDIAAMWMAFCFMVVLVGVPLLETILLALVLWIWCKIDPP